MEREIKFRAYNPKEKKMSADFTLYEITLAGSKTIFPFGFVANKDTILMQYTGLKDKNGKEVYEGDIVKWRGGAIREVVFETRQGNGVIGSLSGFYYKWGGNNISAIEDIHKTEVIGNIYENPNLIKDNK